ncbi:hypothetical protein B0H19DRAFT_1248895 [Mycena capillaripes]|nr:hypothetical protein B0H19DRAFT_1257113 [Mycena capillaripes]KAJ6589347.1 hypothetical protein B0H19DRAFT_1248895 [Mycena capillaripes]
MSLNTHHFFFREFLAIFAAGMDEMGGRGALLMGLIAARGIPRLATLPPIFDGSDGKIDGRRVSRPSLPKNSDTPALISLKPPYLAGDTLPNSAAN